MMNDIHITSIERLRAVADGEVVELPPFIEGEPFVAKLKRPSLLGLASGGYIPNPLLKTAHDMFNGKVDMTKDEVSFKETADMLKIIAENALAQPTYSEFEEMGLQLTDIQLLAISNYALGGVKALAGFRSVQSNIKDTAPEPAV